MYITSDIRPSRVANLVSVRKHTESKIIDNKVAESIKNIKYAGGYNQSDDT